MEKMPFRAGDRVSVPATIKFDQKGDATVFLEIDGCGSPTLVAATLVTMVRPRINVGEDVWNANVEQAGKVVAKDGDWLWVSLTSGGTGFDTWHIDRVELTPPPIAEAAA